MHSWIHDGSGGVVPSPKRKRGVFVDGPLALRPVDRRDADAPQRSGLGSSFPRGKNRVPRRSFACRLNCHGPGILVRQRKETAGCRTVRHPLLPGGEGEWVEL